MATAVLASMIGLSSALAVQDEARTAVAVRNGLIAFMRPGRVGEYDIWVVRPNGTKLRRVTTAPRGHADYNPSWSPDGATIVFERRGDPDGEDLYTVPATGGAPKRLIDCTGDCWSDGEARWSSDGSRIAFGRATGPRSAPGPSLVAIYVANGDGSGIRRLSHPPAGFEDHYPTWAPDGRTIVFQRDTSTVPPGPTKLVAVDVESGAERILYALPDWAPGAGIPSFSPDGKQILFSFWCIYGDSCPRSTRTARNARLATIRPDGTGLKVLPLKARGDSGTWSPDGTRIAFRCWPKTGLRVGNFRLCASKPDGTRLKRFPWRLDSAHPSWGTHS